MRNIVCLIFKNRFFDNVWMSKLAEFSEHKHSFDYHDWIDEAESISEETSLERDHKDLYGNEVDTACWLK